MKIKTSELTGAALDWAVAKCDDRRTNFNPGGGLEVRGRTEEGAELPEAWDLWMPWHPSTNWTQGGPILEREGMTVGRQIHTTEWSAETFDGTGMDVTHLRTGPTALVAAMRCYVASMLGDEVEVPQELA